MKRSPHHSLALWASLGCLTAALPSASAGTFTANFNDGAVPAGLTLHGVAKVVPTGGVGGSGYISLTDAIGSQQGGLIVDDLNAGNPIGGFTVSFSIQVGGGGSQPADGFSLSVGDDIADGAPAEEGVGNGFRVAFDTYDNGGGEAPAIDLYYNGNVIARTKFDGVTALTLPPVVDPATGKPASLMTGTNFAPVVVTLKPNGTVDLTYKGIQVYKNQLIPDYTPKAARFALGARTGGSVETHWVDDLSITTEPPATGVAGIQEPPANLTVEEHASATFTVVPKGAPPYTFQWFRDGNPIPDATSNSYTLTNAPFSANGAKFKVSVSNSDGSASSSEAVLSINPDTVKPTLVDVVGSDSYNQVTVVFSEPVTESTANKASNYTVDGGLTVSSATVLGPNRVRLATSQQTPGTVYKVTVNNINDAATTPNTIATDSSRTFTAFVRLSGGLKFEAFLDLGTASAITGLTEAEKFINNQPDIVAYVSEFTSRLVFTDSSHEGYGGRISGWIIPPETASYQFFLRSDDSSQLFLSPDDKPENATMIAEETGCCGPFEDLDVNNAATETSAPQSLEKGRRYFISALWKEGGGGDYCDVAWRKVGDPAVPRALPYIQGNVLETIAPPNTFTKPTIVFTSPEKDAAIEAGVPVTLSTTATAAPGKSIARVEFYENGKKVGEATTAPFALTLTGLSEDPHSFTARAIDSAGIFTDSAVLTFAVGVPTDQITLLKIDENTRWRYDRSGQDLGTDWRQPGFNDSAWPSGPALIADETTTTVEPIRTAISRFNDEGTYVKTFYFRTHFNFPATVRSGVKLKLRHVVDDGVVFYLNGVEVHRFGIATDAVVDATTDAAGHENIYEGPFDLPLQHLVKGDNVLTAEVHQSGGSSSDMVFGAELIATVPRELVSVSLASIDDSFTWRYDRSGQDLGTDWRQPGFNDASWPSGKALIADESTTTVEPIRTPISRFNDEGTYVKTFYFRTHFNFPSDTTAGAKLKLRHVVDDGVVFYLNGFEIHRFGFPADAVIDATSDPSGHENAYEGPYDIALDHLKPGDNVLAAEVHNAGGSSSDMVFGAELKASFFRSGLEQVVEPPTLDKPRLENGKVILTWSRGKLEASDNPSGPYSEVLNAASPLSVDPIDARKFYRVRQ